MKKITDDMKIRMVEMYYEKKQIKEISAKLGISASMVNQTLRRLRVTIPVSQRPKKGEIC